MFALVRRFLKGIQEKTAEDFDPWAGSGGTYVATFRRQIDAIANELSSGRPVRARFNRNLGCAELHTPGGGTLARIKVHGETCSPYRAIVTTTSLPETAKELFERMLPVTVDFEPVT